MSDDHNIIKNERPNEKTEQEFSVKHCKTLQHFMFHICRPCTVAQYIATEFMLPLGAFFISPSGTEQYGNTLTRAKNG